MKNKFAGIFTALITPFKNGQIDFDSLKKLINFQLENDVSGFVVNGTTAESPALDVAEVKSIFNFVREQVGEELPLIVGTGSNATKKTVEFTKLVEDWGADGALVVVPYYNKPTQEGLFQHFKELATNTKLPVILYNVPGRTITELKPETLIRLQEFSNIVGVKEASGDMSYIRKAKPDVREDFLFTSGDDGSALEFISLGGRGVISVISHILPKEFVELSELAQTNISEASESYKKYEKLLDLLFIEPNPVPVKTALYYMGVIESAEVRLPLVEMSSGVSSELKEELQKLKMC